MDEDKQMATETAIDEIMATCYIISFYCNGLYDNRKLNCILSFYYHYFIILCVFLCVMGW